MENYKTLIWEDLIYFLFLHIGQERFFIPFVLYVFCLLSSVQYVLLRVGYFILYLSQVNSFIDLI